MDTKDLRELSNRISEAAGVLTEAAFKHGRDLDALGRDLASLRSAADTLVNSAKAMEARAARSDKNVPFCLGCRQRTDDPGEPGGIGCALAMDVKEAVTRRQCKRYDPA